MRKVIYAIMLVIILTTPVFAMEFTAPEAPENAQRYMPEKTQSFADDLLYVIKAAVKEIRPDLAAAASVCVSLVAITVLASLLQSFPGASSRIVNLITVMAASVVLIRPSNALVNLGVDTVRQLSEYGKLLLPVMTAALSAQGGITSSAALYAGTALFNTILTTAVSKLIVPMLYIHICLCIACCAAGEDYLKDLKKFVKWLITWLLKITLYLFTGYMGITGVVSGSADAAAVKAAKLTISGVVPVVGSILSDASETILVSAGVMKSAAGVYGLIAMIALCIGPFLQIGVQYLLLKITGSVCGIFGVKSATDLIHDFCGTMGLILAMTGTVCLILLISTVCFMKGVS